jgi:transposase
MVQGKAVPESVQWIIVRLSPSMSAEEVAMYTDVGVRTVKKILSHFAQTGEVISRNPAKLHLHRALTDYDIEVSTTISPVSLSITSIQHMFAALDKTPDLYLEEMRQDLFQRCGVLLDTSTIWRTLIKGGYTMKRSIHLFPAVDFPHFLLLALTNRN